MKKKEKKKARSVSEGRAHFNVLSTLQDFSCRGTDLDTQRTEGVIVNTYHLNIQSKDRIEFTERWTRLERISTSQRKHGFSCWAKH